MTIRTATEDDWPAIWPFFRDTVAAGETYAYPADLTPEQGRDLWLSDPHVVVLEEDGAVLGTAKMGPNRPAGGAHIGTASFMVAPAARGRGVGEALVRQCEERAAATGATRMWLSTLDEMGHAQRIYTRLGYHPEPARDWDPQPELLPDVHLRAWTKEL